MDFIRVTGQVGIPGNDGVRVCPYRYGKLHRPTQLDQHDAYCSVLAQRRRSFGCIQLLSELQPKRDSSGTTRARDLLLLLGSCVLPVRNLPAFPRAGGDQFGDSRRQVQGRDRRHAQPESSDKLTRQNDACRGGKNKLMSKVSQLSLFVSQTSIAFKINYKHSQGV